MCSYCEELFQASKHLIDLPAGVTSGSLMPALTGIKLSHSLNPKTYPLNTLSSYRPPAEIERLKAEPAKQATEADNTTPSASADTAATQPVRQAISENIKPQTSAVNTPSKQPAVAEKAQAPAYALNTLSNNEINDLLQDLALGTPTDAKPEPAASTPQPTVAKPVEAPVAAVQAIPAEPVVPAAAASEPAAPESPIMPVTPAAPPAASTSKEELNWTLASLVALTVLIMQLFYMILLR